MEIPGRDMAIPGWAAETPGRDMEIPGRGLSLRRGRGPPDPAALCRRLQRLLEFGHGLDAVGVVDRQRLHQHLRRLRAEFGPQLQGGPDGILLHPVHRIRRDLACHRVIIGGGQGVHVREGHAPAPAHILLRRGKTVLDHHVQTPALLPGGKARRAEVEKLHAPVRLDDDVVGRDVPVDHAFAVDDLQRVHQRHQQRVCLLLVQGSAQTLQVAAQRLALQILHDEVGGAVFLKGAVDPDNGLQPHELGQGLRLGQELLQAEAVVLRLFRGGQLHRYRVLAAAHQAGGVVLLDGHAPSGGVVVRDIGDAEAALPQHSAQHISAVENAAGPQGEGVLPRVRRRVVAAVGAGARAGKGLETIEAGSRHGGCLPVCSPAGRKNAPSVPSAGKRSCFIIQESPAIFKRLLPGNAHAAHFLLVRAAALGYIKL